MSSIELTSKIVKDIFGFNQIAKTSFTHYYLKFNGEAASTLKYHTGEDRLSYSKTNLGIYEFFTHLGLGPEDVLFVDAIALYKALDKKTKISHGFILDGVFNIVTENVDVVKTRPDEWTVFNGKVTIPVARVKHINDCKKAFALARLDDEMDSHFVDISDMIPTLLKKKVIRVTNNGHTIIVGKPLFPALTNKCKLFVYCHPHKEGLFKAHFRIEKEQVCNYHTYIAFAIFD